MSTNYEDVVEFHVTYGVPVGAYPRLLEPDRQQLRFNLIEEELKEYRDAVEAGDMVEAADALADLLYVVYGTCVEHGFDADLLFKEVHRANRSKLGEDGKPIYRESDQKVLKGPNYTPPDIRSILDGGVH